MTILNEGIECRDAKALPLLLLQKILCCVSAESNAEAPLPYSNHRALIPTPTRPVCFS